MSPRPPARRAPAVPPRFAAPSAPGGRSDEPSAQDVRDVNQPSDRGDTSALDNGGLAPNAIGTRLAGPGLTRPSSDITEIRPRVPEPTAPKSVARVSATPIGPAWPDLSGAELIYESDRTRIARLRTTAEGPRLICKEPLGPNSTARRSREQEILERLAGIKGVPTLVPSIGTSNTITTIDSGGISLADTLRDRPIEEPRLLQITARIASILIEVHHRGVTHKDLNPTNIVLSEPGPDLELIDFELASTYAEERPNFIHHREIAGTLAYLAPEQTGRTGRSVDKRADLYALGVTLYEMATGRLPFDDADPLRLVHDHLARIPTPPFPQCSNVSPMLSAIIMRLLEKEPDRRYQGAEGLLHDISRLIEMEEVGTSVTFRLGERDFPARLSPPSRLIGRDEPINALRSALENAVKGSGRGVLIAGAPGVGKTVVIDELRPMIAGRRGWFVSGKFDQYRRDSKSEAVQQALGALGRLILAEPESELDALREQVVQSLGPNLGLIAQLVPEFRILLGHRIEPPACDPDEAEVRLRLAIVQLLTSVASPERPLVMVLDDLQWANTGSIRIVDAILTDERIRGLLLVGAYRDAEVNETHPLSAMMTRWDRLGLAPRQLKLQNLPPADLSTLLEEMLRLRKSDADRLSSVIGGRTGGNPYDTVELLNALRQDDALVPHDQGWTWDEPTIRRFVGQNEIIDLLAARIARLPEGSQRLLAVMACLGGEVSLGLLRDASGLPSKTLRKSLAGPLEDGLLVMEHTALAADACDGNVRFRHDRVQQACYGGLLQEQRLELHLEVARRLVTVPDRDDEAAALYLPASAMVHDPDERRCVAGLFRGAAARARLSANFATADHYLRSALGLLGPGGNVADDEAIAALEGERHAVLYSLGELEKADDLYWTIVRRCPDPLVLSDSACIQIRSLTNRDRHRDAIALGFDLLRRLGMGASREDPGAELRERLDELARWASRLDLSEDISRPEMQNPNALAAARIVHAMLTPSFFCDPAVNACLILEGRRLWEEYGPCPALVACLSGMTPTAITFRDDYRTGYTATRHAIAVGKGRGYESETAWSLHIFNLFCLHWYEPIEKTVPLTLLCREGLLRGGDLQFASFSHLPAMFALLDCAPSLEACAAEAESGLAFAARVGNDPSEGSFRSYRQLVRTLRGETDTPGEFSDRSFDEAAYLAGQGANPMVSAIHHVNRSLAAVIFNDPKSLKTHVDTALNLLPFIQGFYLVVHLQVFQALSLLNEFDETSPERQADRLARFDDCRDWLAKRVDDASENFSHLLHLINAERARTVGDPWTASSEFDSALREAEIRQRPWHRALIAERAGRFHMDRGQIHAGQRLLAGARNHYAGWGASAKVVELEREFPCLRSSCSPRRDHQPRGTGSVTSEEIDLMAVLRASQALSSETDLRRLEDRLVEVLAAITGATTVLVVLRDEDRKDWCLSPAAGRAEAPIPLEEAGALGLIPLSAFRYVERTGEPLLVEDASQDDRFASDPYLLGVERCSLLVAPIVNQGLPRAVLILENRLSRGVFTSSRLDSVALLGGQLAISLNNAMLYASLERRVTERTEALANANRRLEALSITDALTGLANRRRFDEVLSAEWQRAERAERPIGAAMLDVDQFKPFNDRYGHLVGDSCLRKIASAVNDSVRRGVDVVARYGGEEFAIILPGAAVETAILVAERARAAIESLQIPHEDSPLGLVTASLGIAVAHPPTRETAEQFLGRADSALYEAKCHGRNRVVSHAPIFTE